MIVESNYDKTFGIYIPYKFKTTEEMTVYVPKEYLICFWKDE